MANRGLRTFAWAALGVVMLLLTGFAVVLGINLSNDAHRKRIVRSVTASLRAGMTADQAENVMATHALEYNRERERIGAMVRTPKGSMKAVHTDTHINVLINAEGLVSGVEVKDVYTGF